MITVFCWIPVGTVWACGPARALDFPIVFTQIPADPQTENRPPIGGGILRAEYGGGGRVVRLDPGGEPRVLTGGFHSACGADVSFDGKRIVFAAKRTAADPWNIWEMNADGLDARQITRDLGNCRGPAYLGTLYTLDDQPWYQVAFVSDAAGALNEYGTGAVTNLYSCRMDGSVVRRLTLNLSDDMDPFLLPDGRVLLAGWQRADLNRGVGGRVSLFGVNTDGTDYALFCGDEGRRIKHMPCVTPDGLVVFVEADRVGWDGAGQLGSVTLRRSLHSYRPITTRESVLYHSPVPLPDGAVLVSAREGPESPVAGHESEEGAAGVTHGVYRFEPSTGKMERVFDDPEVHDIHARVLVSWPEPDGRSSVVNLKLTTGKLYGLDVYVADPTVAPHLRQGMIKHLRVIEGVPLQMERAVSEAISQGPSTPGVKGGLKPAAPEGPKPVSRMPMAQRRLLGQVPVEEDGSFQIELPADVPVLLQTLDENGMALRTCGWIWVKQREPRGCIGCHENPELTPENRFVLAVQRPATKLTLPPEKRRTVDFRRDLMPILTQKCASCHSGKDGDLDLRPDPDGLFNRAYRSLLAGLPAMDAQSSVLSAQSSPVEPVMGRYVHPGQARTSPLIWRLYGRNMSRPWDPTYQHDQTVSICPPSGAEPLTSDEKLTLVEWIDLGALWDGIPGPSESSGQEEGQPAQSEKTR